MITAGKILLAIALAPIMIVVFCLLVVVSILFMFTVISMIVVLDWFD